MADGEKVLGIGPKMMVALVFSVLLIVVVVGKWNSVSGVSSGEVVLHFNTTRDVPPADQPPPPRAVASHTPPPALPAPPQPPVQPVSNTREGGWLGLQELGRIIDRDINGQPQDPKDVERLLQMMKSEDF